MGTDVVALQMKLKELGYLSAQERADGIFGRATDEAVKRFQNERGWPEDGVVNKQLLDILGL
jgi:peptidoglycan hydrolase-like protein with peptidoglycan-binding domain